MSFADDDDDGSTSSIDSNPDYTPMSSPRKKENGKRVCTQTNERAK